MEQNGIDGVPYLIREKNYKLALDEFKKQFLIDALVEHEWNITTTAQDIGVDRCYVHRLINQFGLQKRG